MMVCYLRFAMTCNECKKKIKDFLNDSLDNKSVIEFVNHVKACPDCMEELSIDFLVAEGLKRLDNVTSFNLQKELEDKLENSLSKAKFERQFIVVIFVVTIIDFKLYFYM